MSKKLFVETSEGQFIISNDDVQGTNRQLPPGIYSLKQHPMTGDLIFHRAKVTSDKFVELPSPEVEKTLHEIRTFIKPETKKFFESEGQTYKHSFFFHGNPGTGKTYLINKITETLKDKGICLYSREPYLIKQANKMLAQTQPDDLVLYVIEEIDELIADGYETELLELLDSGLQRANTIFTATTNYFNKVPKRLIRPGRFTSIIKVNEPNAEARRVYLTSRLKDKFNIAEWVEYTKGFTIDEIKATVDQVMFYGADLKVTLKLIKESRE